MTPIQYSPEAAALSAASSPNASLRLALTLALVAAGISGCTDSSPVGPDAFDSPSVHAQDVPVATSLLVGLVDDASSRVLVSINEDAPLKLAFASLRQALVRGNRDQLMNALNDAELALEFSRVPIVDEADRDALALQLQVVRSQLSAGF